MEPLDFSRSKILNNVPIKKLSDQLSVIENSNDDNQTKRLKTMAITRFAESNVPVEYWHFSIDKDYVGDKSLLQIYNDYIKDVKNAYISGKSYCFAGQHGVGKTSISCSILKKAALKGYSCLYTNLSDIVSVLTDTYGDERASAKRELLMVDFLVIDEFDPRFMPSDNAADLYARTLESILRTRSQNKQPILMCTNSPNVIESFNGSLKASIDSLMKGYIKMIPVFGEDFRKKKAE